MKTIAKIALGIILATILIVAGCSALIGGAASEVQKESDAHAITVKQYKSIHKGEKMHKVLAALGKPDSKHVDSTMGVKDQTCLYYNNKADLMGGFQFCFDGKTLFAKSSYGRLR